MASWSQHPQHPPRTSARTVQRQRYGEEGAACNAEADLDRIELAGDARTLAEQAADKLRLSARSFTRMLCVARSIADLAGGAVIRRQDIAEALAFRHRTPGHRL
jgi:magnesium chelatase family protein